MPCGTLFVIVVTKISLLDIICAGKIRNLADAFREKNHLLDGKSMEAVEALNI